MPQKFLRTSAIRRSAVYLALSLVCVPNAVSALRLLLRQDHLPIRTFQLLAVIAQGCLAVSMAIAKHESPVIEFSSIGSLSPLATFTAGKGFLLNEALQLLFHATLSWYPLEALDADTCHAPRVNILMQQAVMTACTAILGIPVKKAMQAWLLVPMYCYLDWRYAALTGIPGTATLAQYMSHRGVLLLLSKLFFSGIPALVMMQSNSAQKVAVYVVCLPLLAVQCFASGIRIFNGMDTVGLWEVWVATVVAFGVGTDFGYVIEELRTQFSRVRMIADDVLPRHVVDTLMQQDDGDDDSGSATAGDTSLEPLRSLSFEPHKRLPADALMAEVRRSSHSNLSSQMKLGTNTPPGTVPISPRQSHGTDPCSSDSVQRTRPNSLDLTEASKASSSFWKNPNSTSKRRAAQPSEAEVAEYAEEHPGACILFADVCGFTSISEGASPAIIVNMLNELFSKFDEIIAERPFLYKLDVIGDCYMVASGLLWHAGDPCPARTITDFAKLMLEVAATVLDPVTQQPLSMRCGIHQGPVVGALLGRVRRKYSLFGDVVNAASRLESTSRPGAIHVSAAIYKQLTETADPGPGNGSLPRRDSEPLLRDESCPMNKKLRYPARVLALSCKNLHLRSAFNAFAAVESGSRGASVADQDEQSGREGGRDGATGGPAPGLEAGAAPGSFAAMLGEGAAAPAPAACDAPLTPVAGDVAAAAWTYRGSIDLKGRAALETYLLQVIEPQ